MKPLSHLSQRLKQPLKRLTPHHRLGSNPLFLSEARRVRWGASESLLAGRILRWIGGTAILSFGAWLFFSLIERPSIYAWWRTFYIDPDGFSAGVLIVSCLAILLVDFNALNHSIRAISGEIDNGRWDLLRVTPLGMERLIRAKVGAAQVRAWRTVGVLIGLRMGVVLISITTMFLSISNVPRLTASEWLTFFTGQFSLLVVLLIFVIEPYWRLRAAAAVGVAFSAKRWGLNGSMAAAGAVLMLSWLVYAVVGFLLLQVTIVSVLFLSASTPASSLWIICLLPLTAVLAFFVYLIHDVLARFGLRAAARWARRL